MLDTLEVIELIKSGVSQRISDARDYSDILNMHITGKDVKKYTEELNNHENAKQKKLREKLLKSNRSLFSFLTRPLDKIFTAKGGSVTYNLSESQIEILKDVVSSVSDNMSIKTFLKKKVKIKYLIDPNGFVMVDVDEDGGLTTNIYNSHDVLWYDNKGNEVQAIIFNPYMNEEDEDDKKKYYRVIDEKTDSIYIEDGGNIYLDEESILDNFFGYVPAYILGDESDPNSELFLSLVHSIIEDANEYLRDTSVNTVHKLTQGYAKYWQYPEACNTCGGSGVIKTKVEDTIEEVVCYSCEGSKVKSHKDASDLMLIDIPQEGEQKITPDVGGYINPSIEVADMYDKCIKDNRMYMFQALWGTVFTTQGENETATSHLLNAQPETERVYGISETFSRLHKFILDCYGQAILSRKDYHSDVAYGTRYLMESPDALLERFTISKKESLPTLLQQDLLDKYYQTEYANNNSEYIKTKKLLQVDPFPSMSAQEVKDLGVIGEDLECKIYYPQWVNQLLEAKKVLMTVDQLKEDLKTFTKTKANGKVQQANAASED